MPSPMQVSASENAQRGDQLFHLQALDPDRDARLQYDIVHDFCECVPRAIALWGGQRVLCVLMITIGDC